MLGLFHLQVTGSTLSRELFVVYPDGLETNVTSVTSTVIRTVDQSDPVSGTFR
jgi:hypothetical protein